MGLELFLIGFFDLNGSRPMGMELGPISWIVVQEYCMLTGLDEEQTADMHYHVGRLDVVERQYFKSREPSG